MTIDVEQLRKDMKAGTQGDCLRCGHIENYGCNCTNLELLENLQEYTARLASEYLALREAADALAEIVVEPVLIHTDLTWIQRRANALAAYRKATQ